MGALEDLRRRCDELERRLESLAKQAAIEIMPPLRRDTNYEGGTVLSVSIQEPIEIVRLVDGVKHNNRYHAYLRARNADKTFADDARVLLLDSSGSVLLDPNDYYLAVVVRNKLNEPVKETGGRYYVSIVAPNVNNPLTDTTKWVGVTGSIIPTKWSAGNYLAGRLVRHSGSTWIAKVATSGTPGVSSNWLSVTLSDFGTYSREKTYPDVGIYVQEYLPLYAIRAIQDTGAVVRLNGMLPIGGYYGYYSATVEDRDNTNREWDSSFLAWAIDLRGTVSLGTGLTEWRLLGVYCGEEAGGTYYFSLHNNNQGNDLTDTDHWQSTSSDPTTVFTYTANIVDTVDIEDGALAVISEPGDFAGRLKVYVTDANTSITSGLLSIVGTNVNDQALEEGVFINNGGTAVYTTTNAFKTITSMSFSQVLGAAPGDTVRVAVEQYPAGILRSNGGLIYLATVATTTAPPSVDWLEITPSVGGPYSTTTNYSEGAYVQEVRPLYAIRSSDVQSINGDVSAHHRIISGDNVVLCGTLNGVHSLSARLATETQTGVITTTTQYLAGIKHFLSALIVGEGDTSTDWQGVYIGGSPTAMGGYGVSSYIVVPGSAPSEILEYATTGITRSGPIPNYPGVTTGYLHLQVFGGVSGTTVGGLHLVPGNVLGGPLVWKAIFHSAGLDSSLAFPCYSIHNGIALYDGTWGTDACGSVFVGGICTVAGTSVSASVITGTLSAANGGTGLNTAGMTGVAQLNAGVWSVSALNLAGTNVTGQLPASKGGTGLDTSGATGVPSLTAGVWSVGSTLGTTLGGLGLNASTFTLGQIAVANGSGGFVAGDISDIAGTLDINSLSGILDVNKGGTGLDASGFAAGEVTVADGLGGFVAGDLNDIAGILQTSKGGLGIDASGATDGQVIVADGLGGFILTDVIDGGTF
jgi:hypothetical protein